jgi:phage host-nuclease inhibitor protein Gam
MAKATRTKRPATAGVVPQNREQAAAAVCRIGEIKRELARREADMNDALARIKEQVVDAAQPLQDELASTTAGLQTWCEANRQTLTGGKVKFADLGTGLVKWALRPGSVRGVPKDPAPLIARIKALGLGRFIRTKEEIDKEAMRADPEVAGKIPGITIGSAGEDFIVEPFEAQLQGAA